MKLLKVQNSLSAVCVGVSVTILVTCYLIFVGTYLIYEAGLNHKNLFILIALDEPNLIKYFKETNDNNQIVSGFNTELIYKLHRRNPETLMLLGKAKEKINLNEANSFFSEAVKYDPKNTYNRNQYISFLFSNHLFNELDQELKKNGGYGLGNEWIEPFYLYGLNLISRNRFPEAIPYWKTVASISPSWSHPSIEYASLLYWSGDKDAASKVIESCRRDQYTKAHCDIAAGWFESGKVPRPGFLCREIVPAEMCNNINPIDN
jgi:hypothetical protein